VIDGGPIVKTENFLGEKAMMLVMVNVDGQLDCIEKHLGH
jgi:hypothetical protein